MKLHFILALLALLAHHGRAAAHAVGVECKQRGNQVAVEVFYDDDTPAGNAKVRVLDEEGQIVAEGRTDGKGLWSLPAPAPGRYRVHADAGAGHRAKATLTIPTGNEAATIPAGPKAADVPPETVTVSEGPTRAEFTRFPWGSLALTLGLLTALGGGAAWLRRMRNHPSHENSIEM